MTTAARSTRTIREGICGKGLRIGGRAGSAAGRSILTVPGVQRMPRKREPRKRPSEIKQPHIPMGMRVVIEVTCDFRGCRGNNSFYHGRVERYSGVIEQKRGDRYLVVTRLYGSFWAGREHMFTRDHDGRTWTTPLLVETHSGVAQR